MEGNDMSTQLIPHDPKKIAGNLSNISQGRVAAASLFLKMGKDGSWVYGVEQDEIEDGAEFMVNPMGFQRGFICWKYIPEGSKEKAQKLGEVMVSADAALIEPSEVPEGGVKWDFQLGVHLKAMDDGTPIAGKEFVYRTTSVGGVRAVDTLAQQVGAHYGREGGQKIPVVTLGTTSYKHAAYGKIYNPVIELVRWIDAPKAKAAAPAPTPKKIEKKVEKKKRR
jgi:hypothetical protein